MAAARACSLARASRAARLARSPAPLAPPGLLARPRRPSGELRPSGSPVHARALSKLACALAWPQLPAPAWSELVRAHGPAWLELGRALPWRAGAHPLPAGARAQDLCAPDEPHGSMPARRGHLRPAGHKDGGSTDGRGRRPAACGAEVAGDATQWRAGAGAREVGATAGDDDGRSR
jgi:hypothetical protein